MCVHICVTDSCSQGAFVYICGQHIVNPNLSDIHGDQMSTTLQLYVHYSDSSMIATCALNDKINQV